MAFLSFCWGGGCIGVTHGKGKRFWDPVGNKVLEVLPNVTS